MADYPRLRLTFRCDRAHIISFELHCILYCISVNELHQCINIFVVVVVMVGVGSS